MNSFLKKYLNGEIEQSKIDEIQLQKLSSLIEKAKTYKGLIEKDALALESGKYDHLSINDRIRWFKKACNNAVYCGQYEVIELEYEIDQTHLF